MNLPENRILPLPFKSAALAFVSMPKTAWYWLDDLVRTEYPGGYKDLMRGFYSATQCPSDLTSALRSRAEAHCHTQMAGLYSLANDNDRPDSCATKTSPAHPYTPDLSAGMPSLYQLFRFLPHPTYLTTVWERRNYHLRPRDKE